MWNKKAQSLRDEEVNRCKNTYQQLKISKHLVNTTINKRIDSEIILLLDIYLEQSILTLLFVLRYHLMEPRLTLRLDLTM